jgi:glycosyltransferase involved in cell wall biosynthesis
LIVTDSLNNGGMERQLAVLAKAMPDTWEVRVAALSDGVFADVLRDAGIRLTVLPRAFRLDIRPAFPLGRIIRSWRPTVVHTYGWISTAASLSACRWTDTPLVDASIQDGAVPVRRGNAMRMMTSLADVVIANSRAGLDAFGIGDERGRVVHNGFDPDRWALCECKEPRTTEATTVVMAARMHRHKDYRTLLEAARELAQAEPGAWRFLAIGSGEDRGDLMSGYADLVESGSLAFPEAGHEVMRLVACSDIGVLLTNAKYHAEGIPNSIMEYMACRLPVVCTDSGGNRELVLEGETGLLVPPGDLDAVVRQLRFLREHPEDARRMGEAGRERIANVFTVDTLGSETIDAYELAVYRHRAAGGAGRSG